MEMFIAIALLCNLPSSDEKLRCQQSYVHCVSVKTITLKKQEALTKCIMERKSLRF